MLVAQMLKNLPTMQETQIWSLGWEDPLVKGMAAHSSILAWKIPWMRSLASYMGSQRVGHNWVTNTFIFSIFNVFVSPLQNANLFKCNEAIIHDFQSTTH